MPGVLDSIGGAPPTADTPVLSYAQLVTLARNAGLDAAAANIAAAVALAESSGRPKAYNGKGCDMSYGPWQINMVTGRPGCDNLGPARRASLGLASNEQLYDPATNARAMAQISSGGKNWTPWSTYNNGAYKAYLNGAGSPSSGGIGGATGSPSSGGGSSPEGGGMAPQAECLIGDISLPGSVPNIPCFFYKSWGYAILGGMALVGGGLVMLVGVLVVAGHSSTTRRLASAATGNVGALFEPASSTAREGRRAAGLERAATLERDRRQTEDDQHWLREQSAMENRDRAADRRSANAARGRFEYNLPRGNEKGRVGFDDEEPF